MCAAPEGGRWKGTQHVRATNASCTPSSFTMHHMNNIKGMHFSVVQHMHAQ